MCKLVPVKQEKLASRWALYSKRLLRQYVHFCTSKARKLSTALPRFFSVAVVLNHIANRQPRLDQLPD
jgi:hypothetical protein